jgi:hypothetical protein
MQHSMSSYSGGKDNFSCINDNFEFETVVKFLICYREEKLWSNNRLTIYIPNYSNWDPNTLAVFEMAGLTVEAELQITVLT